MTARIGGKICATDSSPVQPEYSNGTYFTLNVPSQDVVPGCGTEGAIVDFFVGDQQTTLSAVWRAGRFQGLDLIVGPPFALFWGNLSEQRDPSTQLVEPFIGDRMCGEDWSLGIFGSAVRYETVVFSSQQEPGCGAEGAIVTFKLVDAQGNILKVADQTGVWHAWDRARTTSLDLTFGSGTGGPSVGTGDAQGGAMPFLPLVFALSAAGVVALGAALALRLRKRT